MIRKFKNYLLALRDRQRICIALSKGASMMNARNIDLKHPGTWEFSAFSQNGEDGILDILRKQLVSTNRYFIEIGAADGIDNNSAWLVVAEKYNGIMIEGDRQLADRAKRMIVSYSIGVECYNMFVSKENVHNLKDLAFHHDPDVFCLDIDGNDYYVAKAVLEAGFRPKIFMVEYNSVFGTERSVTIPYKADFVHTSAHHTHLYFGVSISGWRKFFKENGYHFVSVDRNGVNGFFVDPAFFDKGFLNGIAPLEFAENQFHYKTFRRPSDEQFTLIADQEFVAI